MHEAILYDKLPDNVVKCNVCQVRCSIREGGQGYCKTRINRNGRLYTIIYERVSALYADPIEKKPLYHFYPKSICLSLGTLGCNFRCPGCQNWEISHDDAQDLERKTQSIKPEETLQLMKRYNCQGISWTYNEPTIWLEYTLDCAKIAKQHNYYTVYVTNGFITPESLDVIGPYLDAFRVDVKAYSKQAYLKIARQGNIQGVIQAAKMAKEKYNIHIECVTNVTPTINDSEIELKGIASTIYSELGKDTPWHVSRFYPHLDLSGFPPTAIKTLERARDIGIEEGLRFVYLGNVPGHKFENTYCYNCKKLLIERDGYSVLRCNIQDNQCVHCKTNIYGRF